MADGPPTLARSSLSVPNHNKPQPVRTKRISATSRSKIVTKPRTLIVVFFDPLLPSRLISVVLLRSLGEG